uniref:F-box domain-containing protein n=1 Tax=Strongyloides stercoralis TaxID=6248 RepID=A0AAF5CW10_STRER
MVNMIRDKSLPKLMTLPEDCLVQIFSHLKRNDIAKSKLVCRSFYNFISQNSKYLSRPAINQITIVGKNNDEKIQLGRVRFGRIDKPKKKSYEIYLEKKNKRNGKSKVLESVHNGDVYDNLNKFMKQYIIGETLRLEQVDFDHKMCSIFFDKRTDLSEITQLDFTLTSLLLESPMFNNFLSRTNCQILNVEFCRNAENIIKDSLFILLPCLTKLQIQLSNNYYSLSVTDTTLLYWMNDCDTFPTYINFSNCQTKFTLPTVIEITEKLRNQNVQRHIFLGEITSSEKDFHTLFEMPSFKFQLLNYSIGQFYLFIKLNNYGINEKIDSFVGLKLNVLNSNISNLH